jgi:uroporphyrinogen-III synthase
VCAPAVEEVPVPAEEVADPLRRLCALEVDWVVFLTGVGVERLYDAARQLKLAEALVHALQRVPVAVRGPKPVAVLGRWGVRPQVSAPSPHTTEELCAALDAVPLVGRRVFVQHYGEPNSRLRDFLVRRGAEVVDALPYRWALPRDAEALVSAVRALVAGHVDALVVTSRPQVLHLFQVAEREGLGEALRQALNERVVVAAVGPTSRQALQACGVRVDVSPQHPKMGPLVAALASFRAGQA